MAALPGVFPPSTKNSEPSTASAEFSTAAAAPHQARENLRKDSRAAEEAGAEEHEASPIDHAIHQAKDDPDAHGRSARAYVRTVVDEPDQEIQRWGALSAAFMSDPSLMAEWRATLAEQREIDAAEAADPVGLMIARLAADGLWLADVCGLYGIDDDMRRRIADRLIALTES